MSARSATRCRRARGGGWRGATDRIRRGQPISRRCVSRRPATGGSGDSRRKSGCCANAASADGPPPATTWSRCRRRPRCAQLVRLAHQRWAIEQHYQDLKTELGLDHFEGRTYPGWQHHMVISAVAYAFHPEGTHAPAGRTTADVSQVCAPSYRKSSRGCCLSAGPDTCSG